MPKISHSPCTVLWVLAPFMLLVLIGCSAEPADEFTPTPNPTQANTLSRDVSLRNFVFEPGEFNIERGTSIEFRLKSRDIEHTFTVKDLGIDWFIPGGKTLSQIFTFNQPGEYQLICAIPGHEQAGMAGTIIVQ